eukprot:11105766-Karenia_brevis.AAC.1
MTPGVHEDGYEEPRVDDNDEEGMEDVVPLAWRLEQQAMEERMMKSFKNMMREVVREELGNGLGEVKEQIGEIKQVAETAGSTASAAMEAVRALRVEFDKLRGGSVSHSGGGHEGK